MLKKLFVGFCALMLVGGMFPSQITWAAYNFPSLIGQFTGGDATTTGPNSYNLKVVSFNGGTAFGSMAGQAASGVAITGGSVNGATIGATTPAAIIGTSVTGTSISAGTGAVSGGAGNFTGTVTSAGQVVGFRSITGSGTVTMAATDYVICVNKTTGSATAVSGPASPVTGQPYVLMDCKGDAATNNITFTPASGNVNGAASLTLNQAYQAVNLVYDGTQFHVF